MSEPPHTGPVHPSFPLAATVGLILLVAVKAFAAPVVRRDVPSSVRPVSADMLNQLPANRDFRAILDLHNKARGAVGAPPLGWNNELAAHAQEYANILASSGTLQHSSRVGRENERENIIVGNPSGITPVGMAMTWINEGRLFRPGVFPNTCNGDWSVCGHYTQIIWPTTRFVGCGYARGRYQALVCRYTPPGNRDGVAIGPGLGTSTREAGNRRCTNSNGMVINCANDEQIDNGGGGQIDNGTNDKDKQCLVDVNLHRPISVAPDEPVIADATELNPGATTLRNDDADWQLGREGGAGTLPVVTLQTDIDRANNANENDLVKVDGINANGRPGVYLFAFPTHAEADRDLGTEVRTVGGGRGASAQELAYFSSATKAAAVPGLPRVIPAGTTSFWTEAKLGGRYRMVIGKLVEGAAPGDVRYDAETNAAYYMKEGSRTPAFECDDQATLTAAVIDIFQQERSKRLTAFDVYWASRPHFRAEVWPGGQRFSWGEPFRLGAAVRNMPGTAVNGERIASMERDAEDVRGDGNASLTGPRVNKAGAAPGSLTAKGRFEGGFQINAPQAGNIPTVNRSAADRYPERVSLQYEVNGERLVRPEYLEVILPGVRAPAAPPGPVAGTSTSVGSQVHYTIVDQFDRVITAQSVKDYVVLYGAGLKAWEALEGQANRVVERGRRFRPDAFNDYLFITATGVDNRNNARPPIGPLGTAQRSQATVRDDRMTDGTFQDTLTFTAPNDANAREALWRAATGKDGATPQETRRNIDAARDEARQRSRAKEGARTDDERNAIEAADLRRIAASSMLAIPQDVILQLRVAQARHDIMVFQGNTLRVLAPYFFDDRSYPGNHDDAVFKFHIRFDPGRPTSQLVAPNHRRP